MNVRNAADWLKIITIAFTGLTVIVC